MEMQPISDGSPQLKYRWIRDAASRALSLIFVIIAAWASPSAFGATCEEYLMGHPEATEAFWRSLQKSAAEMNSILETRISNFTKTFMATLQSRKTTSHSAVPTISQRTLLALEARAAFFGLDLEMQSRLAAEALRAIDADPYFMWLKHHAVDNRLQKFQPGSFIPLPAEKKFEPSPGQADPIQALMESIMVGGTNRLPPDLAIIRIIRDFDPEITPNQMRLAQLTLNTYKGLVVMNQNKPRYLNADKFPEGTAWSMAPDLKTARKNLLNLSKIAFERYGEKFPNESFEMAKTLIRDKDSSLEIIRGIPYHVLRNRSDLNAWEWCLPELDKLRQKLNLPVNLNLIKLDEVIREVYSSRSGHERSYTEFLLRNFAPVDDSLVTYNNYTHLVEIIDFAESIGSEQRFAQYLAERLKNMNFWY